MNLTDIARLRLQNHGLLDSPFTSPLEVVGWFVGMQAQEYTVAKWSIGQRSRGVDEAAVDDALARGAILRTHVLRPTWHFVLSSDIRWLLDLIAPRVHAMNASYYRKFGVEDQYYRRSEEVVRGALEGGNHLTRAEIAGRLAEAGFAADGLQMAYVLMRAELDQVVCSGAPRGKQQTYALFDERVPPASRLSRDEGLAALTRRYFTSRGPATVRDYRWWSSLSAKEANVGVEMIREELEFAVVSDRTFWFAPAGSAGSAPSGKADLLQGYDEYIIAYRESKDIYNLAKSPGVLASTGVTPFTHALVVDGQVAGHWRRQATTSRVQIEIQLARALSTSERRAFAQVAEEYGRFCGMPTTLSVMQDCALQ